MKITIKEIAKEAGVSTASVSHVINGTKQLSEETTRKIKDVISKYNFIPNKNASNLSTTSTKLIGVLISSVQDHYVTSIITSMSHVIREHGYQMLFVNTNEDVHYETDALNLFVAQRVEGILISPVTNDSLRVHQDLLKDIPVVQVIRSDLGFSSPKVTADDFNVGYIAAKYLLQSNVKKIGLVYSRYTINPTLERICGFETACTELHYENIKLYEQGFGTVEGGYSAIKQLLKKNPEIDGIFTLNDFMAIGCLKYIKEHNSNIQVVAFSDFAAADLVEPPISCIAIDQQQIGIRATEILFEQLHIQNSYIHEKIPIKLKIRNKLTK